jgi:multiple sugar transport system ATP-binding protein
VTVGIRPDAFRTTTDPASLPAVVEVVEELGTDAYFYAALEVGGRSELVVVRADPDNVPARGEHVRLGVRPDRLHFFDTGTGKRV